MAKLKHLTFTAQEQQALGVLAKTVEFHAQAARDYGRAGDGSGILRRRVDTIKEAIEPSRQLLDGRVLLRTREDVLNAVKGLSPKARADVTRAINTPIELGRPDLPPNAQKKVAVAASIPGRLEERELALLKTPIISEIDGICRPRPKE